MLPLLLQFGDQQHQLGRKNEGERGGLGSDFGCFEMK